jgi:hypothetical protein
LLKFVILLYVTIYASPRHESMPARVSAVRSIGKWNQNEKEGVSGEASQLASHHLCEEACTYFRRLLHFYRRQGGTAMLSLSIA